MEAYNTLQLLGKGSFGTVHLCERKHNRVKIVVKEIHCDKNLDGDQLKVAKNEVAILRALNHPNVIEYYDSVGKNGSFFIVMEYATHGNLHEFIKNRKPEMLPKKHVLNIFCQILLGLNHIHGKKIMHRDLKCENIFLSGAKGEAVKIGDFGISKSLLVNNKANTIIGTTNYIAPEICDGRPYDTKSDIWSLGCILYELCALERLFDGTVGEVVASIMQGRIKSINREIYDSNIQKIINSMVQINPDFRPSTQTLLSSAYILPLQHDVMMNLGMCD